MSITLNKINKGNGKQFTQDDIKIIDDNTQLIQDTFNNSTSAISTVDRTNLNNIGDTTTLSDTIVNKITSNSNKIGDLNGNGITETDLATAIKNDRTSLSEKANDTDSTRTTTDKTVTGSINELNSLKANKAQESWIAPTLVNSWINSGGGFATTGYFKDTLGMVHLKGNVKNGTTTINTTIFTLPTGYKPSENHSFPVYSNDGGVIGTAQVLLNGDVRFISGGTNFSLCGITFKAEA